MLLTGGFTLDQLARKKGSEKPKGFYKQGGKVKPITPKKGITEDQMKISVKGNNDTIKVDSPKIKHHGDILQGKSRNDVKINSQKFETIGDMGDESLFKIKDLIAKPSIGDKEIPSDLYVKVTNMYEATGDKQFEKEPYFAELILLPKMDQFSKEALEKVASSSGLTVEDLMKSRYAPMDIVGYGYSIRLAQKSGNNIKKLLDDLAKDAPAHATMIGFDLDRPWNRAGTTGWDSLAEMVR